MEEIATHLGRDVRTAQRWEQRDGLPVRRLQHSNSGSVFAYDASWTPGATPAIPMPTTGDRRTGRPPRDAVVGGGGMGVSPAGAAVVMALLVARAGRAAWRRNTKPPAALQSRCCAGDLSGSGDAVLLRDGMTEALIAQLSTASDLRVNRAHLGMQFAVPAAPPVTLPRP